MHYVEYSHLIGGIFTLVSIIFTIYQCINSKKTMFSIKQAAIIISIASVIGFLLTYLQVPEFILPFLSIEISIVVPLMIMFLLGFRSSIIVAFNIVVLHYIFRGSNSIPVDQFAMFLASLMYLDFVHIIYNKYVIKNNELRVIISLLGGTLATTVLLTLFNYTFITPIYIDLYTVEGFFAYAGIEEPDNFMLWILSVYIPFNFVKFITVSLFGFFGRIGVYKLMSKIDKG